MREVNNALQLQYETAAKCLEELEWMKGAMSQAEPHYIDESTTPLSKSHSNVRLLGDLSQIIAMAPTYWVSSNMCRLLEAAASDFPPTYLETVNWDKAVFADRGFVVFNYPIEGPDYKINTLVWHRDTTGAAMVLVNLSPNMWDEGVADPEMFRLDSDMTKDTPPWLLVALAFLLLAPQKIALKTARPGARQLRRQGRRRGHDGEVTVVTLRTPENRLSSSDEHPIDWDHRWPVLGHWRNQWYPSVQDHKLIWIFPYIKGPEDKPLVIKHRVFKLIR